MTKNEAIGRVLTETIEAFIVMDLAKLERLEEQIVELSQSDLVWTEDGKQKVLDKKRVLEVVLQNGEKICWCARACAIETWVTNGYVEFASGHVQCGAAGGPGCS